MVWRPVDGSEAGSAAGFGLPGLVWRQIGARAGSDAAPGRGAKMHNRHFYPSWRKTGSAGRAKGARISAFGARRTLRSGARGATGRRARHFGSICIFQQDQREERRARARPSTRFRGCLGLIWAPITSRGGPNRPLRPGEDAAQRTDKCIST